MSIIPKSKLPVILFKKLGKYIGISSASGDFYDISPEAFDALQELNRQLSLLDSYSEKVIQTIATKLSIPSDIIALFPLCNDETMIHSELGIEASLTDITLNLTSECNLKCVYCWNDQGRYSNPEFKNEPFRQYSYTPKDMSIEIARKAVDFLLANCGDEKQLVVDFYGGEPLKNLETLEQTVIYCREKEKPTDKHFHFLLATNGTLLTPSIAEKLISIGVQIAVSIDGPQPVHDHNRPFPGGQGSFETITHNLEGMPESIRKKLVGRTTVTPYYPDMTALYDFLKSLGFERIELFESEDACHKITSEREKTFFNSEKDFACLSEEYRRLALKYIDEVTLGRLDYKKTFFNRFFKLMQRLYYNHEVSGGCPAAHGQVAVSANGDIYPCTSFLGIEAFNFGNVETGMNSELFNRFLNHIKNRFQTCFQCDFFSVCRTTGSCLNINYYFNGDVNQPYSHSCELFIEKLKLAMASLSILTDKIPEKLEELFGNDPVGRRGNELY